MLPRYEEMHFTKAQYEYSLGMTHLLDYGVVSVFPRREGFDLTGA